MFRPLALLTALIFVLMTAGAMVEPPALRAPGVAGFDARAAQARLRAVIAPEVAHPIDSAAEDVVRGNLLREISALGLAPQVRDAFACRPSPRRPIVDCGHVRNIVFSMGPDRGPAVLAAGHYDSVAAGPGVTDDGMGVAVLLEVARELSHTPLKRRVIFLLSDGEEQALLGAYDFAQHDPLMRDVQALIELEARGTRGPAVFFETNTPNADAVRTYAGVARPVANSIMADIYRLLPNSTDVTVLKRPGLDVINIAVLEGVENYHTPNDDFASQDLRSVQHMGDEALSIVRDWSVSADRSDNSTLVYTDIVSRTFVALPAWLSSAALALSTLIAFFAFWRTGAVGRWRSFALPVASLLAAALLGAMVWAAFTFLRNADDLYWWAHPEPTRFWCVALGLLGAPLATLAFHPRCSQAQAESASLFWFCAIGVLATLALPGISILFVFPAVIYAMGVLLSLKWKWTASIAATLAALVTLLIWAPMMALNELALGFQFPFANTLLFALAVLPWLGALVFLQRETSWRWPVLALSTAALAGIVVASVTPSATRERPLPLNLGYFYNTSTHQARILAGGSERALPRELSQALHFTPEIVFPGDVDPYWTAPAAAQELEGPTLEDVRVTPRDNGRALQARLRMHGAARVYIRIPLAAKAAALRVNAGAANFNDTGPSSDAIDYVTLDCEGRSCDGAEIEMMLGATPTEWSIIGLTRGLVAPAQAAAAARPATRTPVHGGDNNLVLTKVRI